MQPDIAGDFAHIADGAEAVTLRRRGSTTTVEIDVALKRGLTSREAEISNGAAVESDATWHLVVAGDAEPRVGDVVIDSAGRHWTILVAEPSPMLGRWKCATRELRIAYGCGERVDIERPVWSDGEIVDWQYVATALPVRIQPMEVGVDENDESEAVFRIVLGEQIELEAHDRFVAGDGRIFYLRKFQQAERIDALGVATVVRSL